MTAQKKYQKNQRRKVARALNYSRPYRGLLMSLSLLFALVAVTAVGLCGSGIVETAGAGFAMASTIPYMAFALPFAFISHDIEDVSDREAAGNQLGYVLYVIHVNDIADGGFPTFDPNSRERGQITLKPGRYVHRIACHKPITSDASGEKSGDALAATMTNTVTAVCGGNIDALLTFVENFTGDKFVILYGACESNVLEMVGYPCKPMIMSFARTKNAESTSITLTFTSDSYQQPVKYIGTLPQQLPVTIDGDSTVLAITPNNNRYVLAPGAAANYTIATLSGISAGDAGRIITVIGADTATAENAGEIAETSTFILADGATFTAKAGNSITFRVMGKTTPALIEQSRIEF